MSTSSHWPWPRWIAHRGAGKLAPENTLAAFRAGAAHGYKAFECDVKLSADGVLFLLHDDTLDRTTNGHGLAAAKTWSDLSQLDAGAWHSAPFTGEPLGCFASIARFCISNELALNIEIKPTPGEEARTGHAVAAEARRLWNGASIAPLISSFKVEALAAAQHTAPEMPRALLLDTPLQDGLEIATQLQCIAVVMHQPLVSTNEVRACQDKNLRLLAYTVNETSRANELLSWGVAGLITDAVDLLPTDRSSLHQRF